MKVTLIRNNMTFSNAWQTLADVPFHALGDKSLQEIQNGSEEAVFILDEELLNASLIDGIKWKDILDPSTKADGSVKRMVFGLVKKSDFVWYLTADGNEVIKLDAIPTLKDSMIEGNLRDVEYEIASILYECLHRTRDFLENTAINILEKEDSKRPWKELYGEKLQKAATEVVAEWRKNDAEKSVENWKMYKNVEFSNFRFFVEANKDIIDSLGNKTELSKPSKAIIEACKNLKGYRNFGSHSVKSLIREGKKSLSKAIKQMETIASELDNDALESKLSEKRTNMEKLFPSE